MRCRCRAFRSSIENPSPNVQGLGSPPTVRLERKIGRLSAEIMERVKDALAFALDLQRDSG